MTLEVEFPECGIVAVWEGGEYIEVKFIGEEHGFHVLNVWDVNKQESEIPFTEEALREEVAEWIKRDGAEDYGFPPLNDN